MFLLPRDVVATDRAERAIAVDDDKDHEKEYVAAAIIVIIAIFGNGRCYSKSREYGHSKPQRYVHPIN